MSAGTAFTTSVDGTDYQFVQLLMWLQVIQVVLFHLIV
jgi:hypothetical protein